MRELPPLVEWRPGDPVSVRPPRVVHGARAPVGPEQVEPLPPAERWPPLPANFTKKFVVDGTPFTGPSPPDTTGAVGPNHFVQAVNASTAALAIFNKSGPGRGTIPLLARFPSQASCRTSSFGDPVVVFDYQASRFF